MSQSAKSLQIEAHELIIIIIIIKCTD